MYVACHDGTLCMLCKVFVPLQQPLRLGLAPSAIPSASARWWLQQRHARHPRTLITLATSANNNTPPDSNVEDACASTASQVDKQQRLFVRALLLSFFACQNQSLFAAKSLIETVLQIYRQGLTYDDMQVTMTMMNLESGYTLLTTIDQDVLLSWVALIMMTLQETGVPMIPKEHKEGPLASGAPHETGAAAAASSTARTETEEGYHMSEGMRGFAKHIIQQYLSFGLTFAKLQGTQSMANIDGASPSVLAMQQNTRLIVLTLEVLRENHIATAYPLIPKPDPEDMFAAEVVQEHENPEAMFAAEDTQQVAEDVLGNKVEGMQDDDSPAGAEEQNEHEVLVQGQLEQGELDQGKLEQAQAASGTKATGGTTKGDADAFLVGDADASRIVDAEGSDSAAPQDLLSAVPPQLVADGYKEAMSGDGVISTMDYVYCFVVEGTKPGACADLISLRSSAIRLLICFMGAALQSLYAVTALVEYTFDAYRRGWTAEDVFLQLRPEEFVQAGGMASLEIAGVESVDDITRELFARWLSLLYITFAQLGVPRPPEASFQEGWAWAGASVLQERSAEEALSMANFVSHVLQQKAKQEEVGGDIDWNAEWQRVQTMVAQLDSDSGTPEALPWAADSVPGLTTDQQAVGGGDTDTRWSGLTLVKVEDASLLESPATQLIAQQMSLVDMAYEHAKGQLTALQEMQAGSSSSVDDDARSINVDDQA